MSKYFKALADVKLTAAKVAKADKLARAMNQRIRDEGEEPDFESGSIGIIKGVPQHYSREEARALVFRLQAFASLVASGALDCWAISDPIEPGKWLIDQSVLEVIATAPLNVGEHELSFDAAIFREITLGASTPEGNG